MMKNLKNWFGLAAVLIFAIGSSSCVRDEEGLNGSVEALPPNKSAIQKHIADHKKERTRSGEEINLEPVIYEGDTVMYVANYGEGWEIFSNSTTMPMVLMRCETGTFDASTLADNPTFSAFFNMSKENLAAEMHDAGAEAQPGSEEWAYYGVMTVNGGPMRKPAPETMVLVGIGENTPTKSERIKHLITTYWSQRKPYNQFIPFSQKPNETNIHVAAGCGAIAAAQYLYYYHFKSGKPSTSVTKGSYSKSTNSYSFSSPGTTLWAKMVKGDELFMTNEGKEAAALLVGYSALGVKTKFSKDSVGGSSSNTSDIAAFIASETGQNLKLANFSSTTVYNLLNQSQRPVLTHLDRTDSEEGHIVIIDDVTKVTYGKEQFYAPSSALANIQNPTIHYGATLESMRALYGNGVTSELVYSSTSYYFRANWGYGPSELDPEISGSLLTVTRDGRPYKIYSIIN